MQKFVHSKKPLFTNNARRRAGLPTRRKGKGKRFKSRCAAWEDLTAWYMWISTL